MAVKKLACQRLALSPFLLTFTFASIARQYKVFANIIKILLKSGSSFDYKQFNSRAFGFKHGKNIIQSMQYQQFFTIIVQKCNREVFYGVVRLETLIFFRIGTFHRIMSCPLACRVPVTGMPLASTCKTALKQEPNLLASELASLTSRNQVICFSTSSMQRRDKLCAFTAVLISDSVFKTTSGAEIVGNKTKIIKEAFLCT